MKPSLFLILFLLFAFPLFSQYHIFSDEANLGSQRVLETSDGGYLVVAVEFCYTPGGIVIEGCTYALHIVKTDSTGEQQWENQLSFYSGYEPMFRLFENNNGSFTLIGITNQSYFCNGIGTWWGFRQIEIINLTANGGLINDVMFPYECELNLVDVIRMPGSEQFAVLAYFEDPINIFNEPEGWLFLMNKNGQISNLIFFPNEEFKGGRLLAWENGELILLYMVDDQLQWNAYNAQLQLIGEATSADLSNTCFGAYLIRVDARRLNNGNLCLLCQESYEDEIHFFQFNSALEILSSNSHLLDLNTNFINFIEDSEGNLMVASAHISSDTILDTQINYFDAAGAFLDSAVIWHAGDDEIPTHLIPSNTGHFALTGSVNFFNYDTVVGPAKTFLLIGSQLPPATAFSADVTCGQVPLTVAFHDHSHFSPVSWYWDFGNGQTSSEQNPTVTYDSSGVYPVSLVATNIAGNDTLLAQDYITVVDPVFLTVAPNDTVCFNTPVNLQASGAETYVWTGEGLSSGTGASVEALPESPGTYSYQVTGSTNGCNAEPISTEITVVPVPEVVINASSDSICLQQFVTLVASGAETYSWEGDGLSSTEGDIVLASPFVPGEYVYTLVGSSLGCSSDPQQVTLIVLPIPEVGISVSSDTICQQESVTIIASGANAYQWTGEGLLSTTGDTVMASPEAPGEHTYSVVGSSNGCSSEPEQLTIVVGAIPIPQISIIETSGDVENDGIICEGDTVNLSVEAFESILWSTGGSGQAIEITPGETSLFSVIVSNLWGCTGLDSIPVVVVPIPVITVSQSPNPLCLGDTLYLMGSGAEMFFWEGPGLLNTIGDTVQAILQDTGTFSFQAFGETSGCTAAPIPLIVEVENNILAAEITVSNCPGPDLLFSVQVNNGGSSPEIEWYFNDQFVGTGPAYSLIGAQNGDEVYCQVTAMDPPPCTNPLQVLSNVILVDCIETGTPEASRIFESYTLAPNPNDGTFHLEAVLLTSVRGRISVFNTLGYRVWAQDVEWSPGRQIVSFALPEASPGVYWLILENGKKMYRIARVVVD